MSKESKTSRVTAMIDTETKNEASKVLNKMGINLSTGIQLFLHQIVVEQKLPFQPSTKKPKDGED